MTVSSVKQKFDSLPPEIQKELTEFAKEFIERWAVEWNAIDIEGREFLKSKGGQIVPLSYAEAGRWVKTSEPVVSSFKKDLASKGYTEKEVGPWLEFVQERLQCWKGQEKAKKIPTAYEY
jgi:TRAP-type C4-dicarboxylate transport system substrate-binding protein